MTLTLQLAAEDQYPALFGILALCGEHLHRAENVSHWYPYSTWDEFTQIVEGRELFAVLQDDRLVGTFHLGSEPLPYYQQVSKYWKTGVPALYLAGLAVLPTQQDQGTGQWVMEQIPTIALEREATAVRFDVVSHNQRLLSFFERLGYERRGMMLLQGFLAVCFEQNFTA